jgi:hypothetical protein
LSALIEWEITKEAEHPCSKVICTTVCPVQVLCWIPHSDLCINMISLVFSDTFIPKKAENQKSCPIQPLGF